MTMDVGILGKHRPGWNTKWPFSHVILDAPAMQVQPPVSQAVEASKVIGEDSGTQTKAHRSGEGTNGRCVFSGIAAFRSIKIVL